MSEYNYAQLKLISASFIQSDQVCITSISHDNAEWYITHHFIFSQTCYANSSYAYYRKPIIHARACRSRVQSAFKKTNSRIDIVTVECESNVKEQLLTAEQLTIAHAKP